MRYKFSDLVHWFYKVPGRYLLQAECNALEAVLPSLFGYHIVQLGGPSQVDLLESSPIHHKLYCAPTSSKTPHSPVTMAFEALPFVADSIDVMVVPHVLEITQRPQHLLNEIGHILTPAGKVVLLVFNQYSLWGLWRACSDRRELPFAGRFFSLRKLKRWLNQSGLSMIEHKTVYHRPPFTHVKAQKRTLFLEGMGSLLWPKWGAVHLIVAEKSQLPLSPIIDNAYDRVPSGVAGAPLEPTSRVRADDLDD